MVNELDFQPLDDRVLVRPAEQESVTSGGIIIPDNVEEKPREGVVVSLGTRKGKGKEKYFEVKPGMTIMFGKYAGSEIQLEDQSFLIMRQEEIIGIIGKTNGKKKSAA